MLSGWLETKLKMTKDYEDGEPGILPISQACPISAYV
jgi:hypothetical protein